MDIPLILQVEAPLVEGHLVLRVVIAVVTPCQGNSSRSGTVHEVIHAVIEVGTRTVAVVGVECILVLEAQTGHHLVGTQVEGGIIGNGSRLVLDAVLPREELITQRDVRTQLAIGVW